MATQSDNPNKNDSRLAVIEERFSSVFGGFARIESSIAKLTEVSSSLKEMLAVHENQIKEASRNDISIFEMIERRKEEYSRGVERVSQRMEDMGDDLRRQIKSEISEYGEELKIAVSQFKESQKEFVQVIENKVDRLIGEQEKSIVDLNTRVHALEKWRWLMIGGGAVIGFILSKWDVIANLLLLKA